MILVVDGDPAFLSEVEERLGSFGYRVLLARDAAQAVELAAVVWDRLSLAMVAWEANSFEIVQQLTRLRPGLPVIAFSGAEHAGILELAYYVGAKATLQKPMTEAWVATARQLRDEFHPSQP